jgi:hypothetical protein
VILNERPVYFYIGASAGDPERMFIHGPGSGATSPRKIYRVFLHAGLKIHRRILAQYSLESVWDWEKYWWRELVLRNHPIQNEEPLDATKALRIRWKDPKQHEMMAQHARKRIKEGTLGWGYQDQRRLSSLKRAGWTPEARSRFSDYRKSHPYPIGPNGRFIKHQEVQNAA